MFNLGDTVKMKKPHACGVNNWEIIRLGADIKMKCMGCGHIVMLPRSTFVKKMKEILLSGDEAKAANPEHYVNVVAMKRPDQIEGV